MLWFVRGRPLGGLDGRLAFHRRSGHHLGRILHPIPSSGTVAEVERRGVRAEDGPAGRDESRAPRPVGADAAEGRTVPRPARSQPLAAPPAPPSGVQPPGRGDRPLAPDRAVPALPQGAAGERGPGGAAGGLRGAPGPPPGRRGGTSPEPATAP